MYKFLVEKYIFTVFAYEHFKYIYLGQNTSIYCSQMIVIHVHANGFL